MTEVPRSRYNSPNLASTHIPSIGTPIASYGQSMDDLFEHSIHTKPIMMRISIRKHRRNYSLEFGAEEIKIRTLASARGLEGSLI